MNVPEHVIHADQLWSELLERRDAFERVDESADSNFYVVDRMVQHLDQTALDTIERLIDDAILEKHPRILDLMASFDSHLAESIHPDEVVGLGLNLHELEANPRLTSRVVHDLNQTTQLPYKDNHFDVVLNTVSIQYLVHPVEVFREVNRVLKPGGLHLVIFSNRMFTPKAVRIWGLLSEEERLHLVSHYFQEAGAYTDTADFVSIGLPRPADDKHAYLGVPSDPIYAVMAEKVRGGNHTMIRPVPQPPTYAKRDLPDVEKRKLTTAETLECPYCGERLRYWAITENPMTTYDRDFYICINDSCPYLVRGWGVMHKQGNTGHSYRLTFDPKTGHHFPTPIPSLGVIKGELKEDV